MRKETIIGSAARVKNTDESAEETLVDIIRSTDVRDGVADLAEAGLDQILQDGFLRDVPLLGTLLRIIRTTGSVRDLLLAKKVGRFLFALQTVPSAEREAFHNSLVTKAERRRVGEALLLLLDRLDDMGKPELVAHVFRAFIRGQIDRLTFQLMGSAIDRLHLSHLTALIAFYSDRASHLSKAVADRDVCQALSFAGLVRVEVSGGGGGMFDPDMASGASLSYERNELGKQFVEIITDIA